MAYTGNVPVYFDGYVERSQFTAPKMDMTGSVGSSWLKSASTMNLAATPDADSSQLSPLLSQLRPYIERLNRTYPELSSTAGKLDDNVLMKHEQTSENDSGIDSLRQHTSPYNSKGRLDTGPSERRFKHIKEQRRKSIGAVVDADEAQSFEDDGRSTTGHRELDHCLRHHLTRCLQTLKLLATRFGPLEYKEQELVGRLDQETTTLEDLLHVSRSLPALPNISNILADLNAGVELQDVWLSASYPANAILIVPAHLLKHEIRSCFGRIVSDRYPDLLDSVMDGLMNLMTDGKLWCPEWITVYQFVGAFRGKNLPPYIESLAHEAWIGAGLSSRVLPTVQMVMDRLLHVPVVPPMESLRHIGLVLMAPNRELHSVIERYLTKAQGQLAEDLIMTYICLLEHDDNESRQGACRALTILNSALAVRPLAFVARCDRSPLVREDARQALSGLVNDDGSDTFEMTKV
uniref:Uncharacterized protein n=1 Tax=Plectus sambesii TaxID=2011161 RepID=A0A914WEA1_9BILA